MVSNYSKETSPYFKFFKMRIGQVSLLKAVIAIFVLISVGCQGQTFQYSRGWTNGKRGAYSVGNRGSVNPLVSGQSPTYDSSTVLSGSSSEESSIPIPPVSSSGRGGLGRIGRQPGRFQSLDYALYLGKKLGNGPSNNAAVGSGNKKRPLWIIDADQDGNPNVEIQ